MNYFDRKEVSNSDLSWLYQQINPRENLFDPTQAYKFGNLVDAVITEQERVDYYKRTVDDVKYSAADFNKAVKMKESFYKNQYCLDLIKNASFQTVKTNKLQLDYCGVPFEIQSRCKWDILRSKVGIDIKSTAAKTQAEFLSAVEFFNYDRQMAWYMDTTPEIETVIIIGISKHNYKIFSIFVARNSPMYINGKSKYLELAYRWNLLFGETKL